MRCFTIVFVGIPQHCTTDLQMAVERVDMALRPHTKKQYQRQFLLFLALTIARRLSQLDSPPVVLLFLEFLASQTLSYRVILNYVSALKYMFTRYAWHTKVLDLPIVRRMLDGIKLTVRQAPLPKMIFSLAQVSEILHLSSSFPDSFVYRSAFLLAFYAFFRISNIAPPFQKSFDPSRHLLRQDIEFAYPGVHVHVKWAKKVQAPDNRHVIKLPQVRDPMMCPVFNLKVLLDSLPTDPTTPLLITSSGTTLTQSMIRRCLTSILTLMQVPLQGVGFHTFRCSAATIAFDAKVPLQTLQLHGLWRSDAIWSYISRDTSLSLQVPLTFQSLVNSLP